MSASQVFADILPWVQTGASLGAVIISVRAFTHTRTTRDKKDAAEIAVNDAVAASVAAEFAKKFDRVFAQITDEAERFRKHDRECAGDKAKLASSIERISGSQERLEAAIAASQERFDDRLTNLERRFGYVARDLSEATNKAKLGT